MEYHIFFYLSELDKLHQKIIHYNYLLNMIYLLQIARLLVGFMFVIEL